MAFMEILFPTNISLGAIGGGGWSTRVVVTDGGSEYRQALFGYTRGRWTVGHNLRTAPEFAQLIAYHRLAMGKLNGFRFLDWTDYQDGGIGILASNASSQLQIAKAYQATDLFGHTLFNTRLISKPSPGTISFFINGTPTGIVSLDYTTGLVSGASPDLTHVYTWTGQFHIPVRFDTDNPEISMDLPTSAGWKGIPLIELRMQGQ
jgi:uncharacterized protein (TIGR02217 family)